MDAFCFACQIVDGLFTLFKQGCNTNIVADSGHVLDIVHRTV